MSLGTVMSIAVEANRSPVHAQTLGRDGHVLPLCGTREFPRTITNSSALVTCMTCLRLCLAKEPTMSVSEWAKAIVAGM